MKSNEILFAREMAEASEDLRRLNEILEDADKFRLKSKQICLFVCFVYGGYGR